MSKPAVVLLSGGLDSATVAAIARDEGYDIHALTIDYGQRHRFELEAADRVAAALGVKQHIHQRLNMTEIGRSALTAPIDVPKHERADDIADGIPITYVPARNTMMLSLALGYAEVLEAGDIFVGVNAVDYSGYPDCRPEFVAAFERLANLATKAGVERTIEFRIHAPLIEMTKAEIIRWGTELGVVYSLTHSCYDPSHDGGACGRCDSCLLRREGFRQAGVDDPTRYESHP